MLKCLLVIWYEIIQLGLHIIENFLQYTDIPTDNLEEWFFVCATYNPNVKEMAIILVLVEDFNLQLYMVTYDGDFHQTNPNDDLKPG